MRRISTLALAIAFAAPALAAQPVASTVPGTTVIDFNSLSAGTVITTQFAGVTISGGLCANPDYSVVYFGGDPMQASNFQNFTGASCDGVNPPGTPITFSFLNPIVSFGFTGVINAGSVVFTTPNGTASVPQLAFPMYFGIVDATPFSSVTVTTDVDGFYAIDDVRYTPGVSAVPEPASIALVAAGLGVIGVGARRRRRASV